MDPGVPTRRVLSETLERVAIYLLLVFASLLLAESLLNITIPLNTEIYAIIVAALFLGAQVSHPAPRRWTTSVGTDITIKQLTFALAGLTIIGAGLRFYALGHASFWFDEAITTIAALGLLEHGRPQFPSGFVYWRSFTHTLLVAGSLAGFGVSEWAARLPSVLAGVATIPVVYWLGHEVGNRRVGLIAAALLTFLTWEIAWSRQARMYQLLQLGYTIALVGLTRVDNTSLRDRGTIALLGTGTLLAALTHQIGLILLPVVAGYLTLHLFTGGGVSDRQSWAVLAGIGLVAISLELLGTGPVAVTRTVLGTNIDHFTRYHRVVPSTLPVVYLLAIVGLGLSFRHWRHGLLLAMALIPTVWILVFHTQLFAMRYLYFAVPILAIYIGFTVEITIAQIRELITWLRPIREGVDRQLRATGNRVPTAVSGTAVPIIITLVVVSPSLTIVPQAGYSLGPNAPQPDFKSAYTYVNSQAETDDALVVGWTAPAQYYHGNVDYWLVHDLTNAERTWLTDDGREIYSGAVPVGNATKLRNVIECHPRGWVVIDHIVYRKLGNEMFDIIANLTAHNVGASGIHVYSWTGSGSCHTNPDGSIVQEKYSNPDMAFVPPGGLAVEAKLTKPSLAR